jgi:hypothetical protein
MTPNTPEVARAEVSELVPLHEQIARQLGEVRLRLVEATPTDEDPLYEKALRYQRVVGRLENRIRVALLSLAQSR